MDRLPMGPRARIPPGQRCGRWRGGAAGRQGKLDNLEKVTVHPEKGEGRGGRELRYPSCGLQIFWGPRVDSARLSFLGGTGV